MSRLRHSRSGHIRSLQISSNSLYVYIEGIDVDKYVYSKVLRQECGSFKYRIIRADEIPGATSGGKSVLTKHFEVLRRHGQLSGDFKCHRFVTLFLMDKDADDLMRTRRRSKHVHYTSTYDIEAAIFCHATIADAVASTCSLDISDVEARLNCNSWAGDAAKLWRDWTVLALTARLSNSQISGYAAPSRVNPQHDGPADQTTVAAYLAQIQSSASLTPVDFANVHLRAERAVDGAINAGEYGRYFKGKWFAFILFAQSARLWPTEVNRVPKFNSRVTAAAAASSQAIHGPWIPMRSAIQTIVGML